MMISDNTAALLCMLHFIAVNVYGCAYLIYFIQLGGLHSNASCSIKSYHTGMLFVALQSCEDHIKCSENSPFPNNPGKILVYFSEEVAEFS